MNETKSITVRVDAETHKILADIAADETRTLSNLCLVILTQYAEEKGNNK